MADVDGAWETVTKSPMGDQKATLTINSADDGAFTGTYSGPMGSVDIRDGKVDGNKLTWTLDITIPMPMTLTGEAIVDGDSMMGSVTAGAFGSFPMSGTRSA